MVSNNKVLTVSYGTFSCTLEGFDDSFETMKAIAEYFRDLAADDRYFGAEPPQPDADMLARIAEREIARQVQARQDGTGIVLRAADPVAAPIATAADQSAAQAPVTQPPVTQATVAQETPTPPPATEQLPEPALAAEPVVAPVDTLEAPQVDAEEVSTQQTQSAAQPAPVLADPGRPAPADVTPDIEPEILDPEVEASDQAKPGTASATPQTPTDSIADKLARIRAVVARNDQAPIEDAVEEPDSFVQAEAADIADTLYEEDSDTLDQDEDPAIDAVLSKLDPAHRATDPIDGAANDDLFEDLDPSEPQEDLTEIALNNILGEDAAAPETAQVEDPAPQETAQTQPDPAPVAEGEPRKIRKVRVRKVKRAELDRALASGAIEEIDDTAEETPDVASTLTPEDEADLMRELAMVSAEINDSKEDDTPSAPAPTPPAPKPVAKTPTEAEADQDISRLMAEAQEKLGDPEVTSQAAHFQHLRAAVAAAEAERSAGGDPSDAPHDDAYRADLAQAVKPRRPTSARRSTKRPQVSKPAPLKLVAAQRVDPTPAPAEAPATVADTVRPRRIATPTESPDSPDSAEAFSAYVAEMEATSLSELLEAAASYMCFVEEREQFSRPQLMNKVRLVHPGDLNREDGLRAFGQLLREGKIQKAGGGRFVASGEIGFQPSARAAG